MNKKLFKQGDIVVCIDPPKRPMYVEIGIDQLEFGEIYKIRRYDLNNTMSIRPLVYLQKWNGFSGSKKDSIFFQKRFILRSSITAKELVFMKVKYKLGIKNEFSNNS